ncbi:S4 domain-containing protein [Mesoaciditoga lauensis]|uniref:S4 domain-containing protein n=1 Tax=Mesoaciditoga lauensis TaxID=1495039 RepID=UPI00056648FA|nr:S4 domain-containing protein [Mesoaciditoga lauensis]
MRLDKFLKVSGIIKRRSVAQKVAELGGILKDERALKPSYDVKVGDVLTIKQRHGTMTIRVTAIPSGDVKGDYFELLDQKKE